MNAFSLANVSAKSNNAILSHDTIRRIAPSVFAESPFHALSERYKMVPTIGVVDMLADQGFFPVKVAQGNSRIEGKRDFTKHVIRFRHQSYLDSLQNVGDEIPELVLLNSHDGTSAYKFSAGIFRLVCLNGLIVASESFGSISVRHSGGAEFRNRVIDATNQIAEETPKVIEKIAEWKSILMTQPVQLALATAAHTILDNGAIKPEQLLRSKRSADNRDENGARDLWRTTNVIQENVIRGGLAGRNPETGRRATTRPVKSVERDVKLNKALWTLSEEMSKIIG